MKRMRRFQKKSLKSVLRMSDAFASPKISKYGKIFPICLKIG